MDWISFTRAYDFLSPLSFHFILLMPLVYIILKFLSVLYSDKRPCLPPGPKPWPIIGNVIHMGKIPHISMAYFAKIHGPLISLRLGTQLLIVGSSPKAAIEILKTHDHLLSGRYQPKCSPYGSPILDRISIISATQCTEGWRFLRVLCKNELFSAKAIASQVTLREKKVSEMLEFLGTCEGKVVEIGEVVFTTVFNIIANLLFSKDLVGLIDNGVASELKRLVRTIAEVGATPNIADLYPIFEGLDPQGLKRKMSDCIKQMFAIWGIYIKERRESHAHGAPKNDFMDVFLDNGFDDDQINWLVLELFSAGADTTTATVEWAMAELLKSKGVMKKISFELKQEINQNTIHEFHVSQLRYLNACVKETLRLHPPAPFLLPHRALETCEVMNYTIPKDSQVLVNVWAIGRDSSIWEDPLSFNPDRFFGRNLDFKGQNYEFLPFGAGRRMCPGLPMATKQIHLILASLMYRFDWTLPNSEDPTKLDMTEKFGLTLQKEQPLLLVPKQKAVAAELVPT